MIQGVKVRAIAESATGFQTYLAETGLKPTSTSFPAPLSDTAITLFA
jgi:hypothetical protein